MIETALFLAGSLLGAYAVIAGGGMFLSIPLFQVLFPTASVGQIVGSIKIGSATRGFASTWATWRQVRVRAGLLLAIPFVVGATLGAYLITGIDQRWILPIVASAIAVSELAPRLHNLLNPKLFRAAALFAGLYGGVLGAGLGVLIVALLRIRAPDEVLIVDAKIQARFVEFLMGVAAITVHFWAGNLVTDVWLPWALGNLIGGAIGGLLLRNLLHVSARIQRSLLLLAYAAALIGALVPYFLR